MKGMFKKQMFVQAKTLDSNNLSSTSTCSSFQSFIDPATYMQNGEFVFKIPPEAPVFEPTVEEFLDPLAYINKIRPIAEKTGICKVKPPPEWHPPFAVDVDHFKFTPRIQKLNELDANTRVKLYFLDRLATYWNYSGVQIRIPAIDDKTVDMYSLYTLVELEGGFDKVNVEKKWSRVAQRMGYVQDKVVGSLLRQHYKRLLLPYEKFEKSKMTSTQRPAEDKREEIKEEAESDNISIKSEISDHSSSPEKGNNSSPQKTPSKTNRRCTRSNCDENSTEILVSDSFKNPEMQDKNKELQRLTFYGPGPKILASTKPKTNPTPVKNESDGSNDLLADSTCMVCGNGDSEESILLCDGCDDGYHTFCLVPPLSAVPKGEWRCPKCIAAVVSKASDTTFGFEQAEKEYSLQQFGEMADQFKSNYFNMPVHMVPTEKVEQEYWKILSSMDSSVSVEYGADLHSMDHGSGFPTQTALKQGGDEYYKSYVESSWNLNNIPVLEGSVLGYINADISGMKIPWMYVGMCFSTFCWHNEDHWSYSINYLHWGEPKTWYGVPGFMAEKFEQVMRDTTPDLFRNQPDLLHQLVTILNPNILMDRGVPVYHIDQEAGEFVLTFPRAYHAGFNHGYNFAEAVNFCPVDWIPLGRECVEHYSSLHRYCVFSHDELVCKMASVPENLNSKLASATHQDMLKMLESENKQRKALLEWGVVNAEREAFELLADDERKCVECNTTCFLSAVTCKCSPKKVTCLRHFKQHCDCPAIEHTLRYRYTLDELPLMLEKLKEKADSVAVWAAKVHDALNINTPRTITLSGLKELLNEAQEKHFPDDLSLGLLSKAIKSVQDALAVDFKNILSHKQTLSKKVTLTEIQSYYEELQRIPCVLPQENTVKQFLKFVDELQEEVEQRVGDDKSTLAEVEVLLKKSQFPNVEIACLEKLKRLYKILQLVEEVRQRKTQMPATLTLNEIDQYLVRASTIEDWRVKQVTKELMTLKERIVIWERKAKNCLNEAGRGNMTKPQVAAKFERLLEESRTLEAVPPSRESVAVVTKRVTQWKEKARALLTLPEKMAPFVEHVEQVINEGLKLELELEELKELHAVSEKIREWRKEMHSMFLGECHSYSLLECLMPRRSQQRVLKYKKNSDDVQEAKISQDCLDFLDSVNVDVKEQADMEKIISSFIVAEKRECELMRALQVRNNYKKKQRDGTFCICSSSSTVLMKECNLCKDLFHEQCLKRLANYWEMEPRDSTASRIFLCPFCRRTRRPSVSSVAAALEKLEKLQVRSFEAVAMRCLLDREAKWRKCVYELLDSPEIIPLTEKKKIARSDGRMISPENISSLETLLFRGCLLELDIPENEIIYMILRKLDNCEESAKVVSPTKRLSSPRGSINGSAKGATPEVEMNSETCSLESDLKSSLSPSWCKEKKRRMENNENDAAQAIRFHFDKVIKNEKLKKQSQAVTKGNDKGPMAKKRKKVTTACPLSKKLGLLNRAKIETIDLDLLEDGQGLEVEEEEEIECEAKECLKPSGEHLDWVQCDYCKNWLHMICIGVTKGEVDDQTEFMCSLCKSDDMQGTKDDENEDDDDDVVLVESYSSKNTAICSS